MVGEDSEIAPGFFTEGIEIGAFGADFEGIDLPGFEGFEFAAGAFDFLDGGPEGSLQIRNGEGLFFGLFQTALEFGLEGEVVLLEGFVLGADGPGLFEFAGHGGQIGFEFGLLIEEGGDGAGLLIALGLEGFAGGFEAGDVFDEGGVGGAGLFKAGLFAGGEGFGLADFGLKGFELRIEQITIPLGAGEFAGEVRAVLFLFEGILESLVGGLGGFERLLQAFRLGAGDAVFAEFVDLGFEVIDAEGKLVALLFGAAAVFEGLLELILKVLHAGLEGEELGVGEGFAAAGVLQIVVQLAVETLDIAGFLFERGFLGAEGFGGLFGLRHLILKRLKLFTEGGLGGLCGFEIPGEGLGLFREAGVLLLAEGVEGFGKLLLLFEEAGLDGVEFLLFFLEGLLGEFPGAASGLAGGVEQELFLFELGEAGLEGFFFGGELLEFGAGFGLEFEVGAFGAVAFGLHFAEAFLEDVLQGGGWLRGGGQGEEGGEAEKEKSHEGFHTHCRRKTEGRIAAG